MRFDLQKKRLRIDRAGCQAEYQVVVTLPVAQLDGIDFQRPVFREPVEELVLVFA